MSSATATVRRCTSIGAVLYALGHPQLPPAYRTAARPALEAVEAELPAEQLAAARLAAAATSLNALTTQLLETSRLFGG